MESEVFAHLEGVFGLTSLRPQQTQAVEAFLQGRDVLTVLPTGFGKSLCFQLPAVVLARKGLGCTLVVSPLIALMDDQVAQLRARGVRAHALHSGVPWRTQREILAALETQELVYVSPERLENSHLRERMRDVARVAVDEAHCISEWGHDFRPEYGRLGWLKRELRAPIMALTATATARVREQVIASLALSDVVRVEASSLRPNLRFNVVLASEHETRTRWAVELLRERGFASKHARGRALVYAATRARAQAVQRALRKAGVRAGYYHAGRSEGARVRAQELFSRGTTPVLVATSAFGMGIDLPDVRLVLHVEAPGSLESYVQQAGRAGRDGAVSECWLAYSPADARTHERLRGASPTPGALEGFRALEAYAQGRACRQLTIAHHLACEAVEPCGSCDACVDPERVAAEHDRAAVARSRAVRARKAQRESELAVHLGERERAQVVAFIDAMPKPVGRRYVMMALRGSRAAALKKKRLLDNPHFGALRGVPEVSIFRAFDELLAEGLLVPKGKKYPTLWVAGKAVRPRDASRAKRARPAGLEAALTRFRRNEARRRRIKPYQVFQNRTLRALCELRPASLSELRAVWGIGEERIERYGDALLALCSEPVVTRSAG